MLNVRRDWRQQVVEVVEEACEAGDVDEHAYAGVDGGAFQHVKRLEERLNPLDLQGQDPTCVPVGPKIESPALYAVDLLGQGDQVSDV